MPIRYSLDPDVEAEAPTIDQRQTRYDARAEVPLGGAFDLIRARGGYANYRHDAERNRRAGWQRRFSEQQGRDDCAHGRGCQQKSEVT